MQVKPFAEIAVTTNELRTDIYRFYHKQYLGQVNPEHGVKYDYDPDRLYLSFDNDKEWALIQYYVFGKLLVTSNYFSQSSSVKK